LVILATALYNRLDVAKRQALCMMVRNKSIKKATGPINGKIKKSQTTISHKSCVKGRSQRYITAVIRPNMHHIDNKKGHI